MNNIHPLFKKYPSLDIPFKDEIKSEKLGYFCDLVYNFKNNCVLCLFLGESP